MDLEADDDDDLDNVSEEERRQAEAFARALESGGSSDEGAALAELALRVRAIKGEPAPLGDAARDAAVSRALALGVARGRRRAALPWLAAAAALLLVVGSGALANFALDAAAPREPLRYGGPASALFSAGFDDAQSQSERLDRITRARSRDYFSALAQRAGAGAGR